MNWDWIVENWQATFSFITMFIVLAAWLYLRYWSKQEKLRRDLEKVVADALEFLKGWVGDEMADVTEAEIAAAALWFYTECIAGTVLDRIVTLEQFNEFLWAAFTRWRDVYISANLALA